MPKHIVRLLVLMGVLGAFALAAKAFFTPESFYQYGHYRALAVPEIAAQEPVFQTHRYCEACHTDRFALWSSQSHKSVTCEVCHGPAKGHPASGKLPIPADTQKLCTLCHEQMAERPRAQPQVQASVHSGGQSCNACHNPHSPKIGTAATVKVAGDAAVGRERAASCAGCHGALGISGNDTWPSLAGQSAPYLARILGAYRSGDQHDVIMTPIAQALGESDVRDLAVYYAGLSCDTASRTQVTGDLAAGRALAKGCAACHGETGIAPNAAWPSLAGQKPGYLGNALKAFRAGLRKDPLMAGVARGLSDADITNLAAFYAVQRCENQTQAGRTP
jgi:cytochrome c553